MSSTVSVWAARAGLRIGSGGLSSMKGSRPPTSAVAPSGRGMGVQGAKAPGGGGGAAGGGGGGRGGEGPGGVAAPQGAPPAPARPALFPLPRRAPATAAAHLLHAVDHRLGRELAALHGADHHLGVE